MGESGFGPASLATLGSKSYDFPFGAAAATATYMEVLSPTPLSSVDHVEERRRREMEQKVEQEEKTAQFGRGNGRRLLPEDERA